MRDAVPTAVLAAEARAHPRARTDRTTAEVRAGFPHPTDGAAGRCWGGNEPARGSGPP